MHNWTAVPQYTGTKKRRYMYEVYSKSIQPLGKKKKKIQQVHTTHMYSRHNSRELMWPTSVKIITYVQEG